MAALIQELNSTENSNNNNNNNSDTNNNNNNNNNNQTPPPKRNTIQVLVGKVKQFFGEMEAERRYCEVLDAILKKGVRINGK